MVDEFFKESLITKENRMTAPTILGLRSEGGITVNPNPTDLQEAVRALANKVVDLEATVLEQRKVIATHKCQCDEVTLLRKRVLELEAQIENPLKRSRVQETFKPIARSSSSSSSDSRPDSSNSLTTTLAPSPTTTNYEFFLDTSIPINATSSTPSVSVNAPLIQTPTQKDLAVSFLEWDEQNSKKG